MMLPDILAKWHRARSIHHASGLKGVIRIIARKLMWLFYRHEVVYIAAETVQNGNHQVMEKDARGTECHVFETAESLKAVQYDIPLLIPINRLHRHLAHHPGSIVILAVRPHSTGSGGIVVGYRLCQRGVFHAPGVKKRISSHILFILNTEVVPEYRGQGVNGILWGASYNYCLKNGLNKAVGIIDDYNLPSLSSHSRLGHITLTGTIELVSLFGGLFKRITPWEEIESALEKH